MKLFVICFIFALFLLPTTVQAAPPIGLVVNGEVLQNLPMNPVIRQDRMLVPARAVFESLGASVEWQAAERAVYIQHNDQDVIVTIGQRTLMVNGLPIEMPIPAQIINYNTMIPVGAVATNLGFEVDFRDRTVFVDSFMMADEPEFEELLPENFPPSHFLTEEEEVEYYENDYYFEAYDDKIGDEDIEPAPADVIPLPYTPGIPGFVAPIGQIIPARDMSTERIPYANFPTATVFHVGVPTEPGLQMFYIVAASPISGVERLLLEDNRLAIDILNSTTVLSGALAIPPHLAASGIRVSQFTDSITRVVFDLESGTEFVIGISPDRMIITLTVMQQNLTDINFEAGEHYDEIVLSGVRPSALRVQPSTGRLFFFISNMQSDLAFDTPVEGNFATNLSLSALSAHALVLDVAINPFTAHMILQTGPDETTIRLFPATYRNVFYDFEARTLRIPRVEGFSIDPAMVPRSDMYHQRQFILWLPDISEHIGFGEMLVGDTLLRSLTIAHAPNSTQLIFNGNQIFTLDLQEDENYYIIRVLHPRERYPRIVIIDPGHGGRDPGAVRAGIRESDLNLNVTRKLLQLIEADGVIRAYTTRNSDVHLGETSAECLRARANFGNHIGDMFVSIHFNAANNTNAHGIETYYRESGLDAFRTLTSRRLADIMHRNKLTMLGSNDRNVRSANFAVLRYSTIPAVLLELGFMSNQAELARINTAEFQWMAAHAIYSAMLEAFAWVPERQ